VAELRITAGEQSGTFRGVAPGSDVTTPFPVNPEERISIECRFADKALTHWKGVAGKEPRLTILPGGNIVARKAGKG
jgi:hypothetical protein